MVNIIKEELLIEDSLRKKIEFICEFAKTTPTIINANIRKINKIDSEKPTISLKGGSTIYIEVNNKYNEYGYNISDNFRMQKAIFHLKQKLQLLHLKY